MDGASYAAFLFITALIIFDHFVAASFYEEDEVNVTEDSIIKRWAGVSRSNCLLRCRRNKQCEHAAMEGADCLFLKNGSDPTSSESDVSNGKNVLRVIVLKEIDSQRKPNKTSGKVI